MDRLRALIFCLLPLIALSPASLADEIAPAPPPTDKIATSDAPEEAPKQEPGYSEEIVVTASRSEQKADEAPVSMSVVPAAAIRSTPGNNYANLMRGLPGMNTIQVSAQQQEFATRGAVKTGTNSQLVLLDGRSVYVDFLGFVEWDAMPVSLEEVERIEVLNGPGSAVWGANSMTGVINVITRAPRDSEGGLFTIGGGERGTAFAGIRWAGVSGLMAYRLSASHFEQDAWERDTYTSGGMTLPSYENQGTTQPKFDGRLDYDAGGGSWSFRAGYGGMSGMNLNGAGPWFVQDGSFFGYGETRYSRGALDASAFFNRISMDAPNQFADLVNRLRAFSYGGDVTNRSPLGQKQVFTYGGTVRYRDCSLSVAPEAGSTTEAGIFLQDDIFASARLAVTVGARADWFSTIGAVLSPRTSVIYRPLDGQTLRFSYGRGYRPPAEVELYSDINQMTVLPLPTGPFTVYTHLTGNEDLTEEKADSYELAWSVAPAPWWYVRSAAFHHRTKGFIQIHPTAFYGPADPPAGWPLPPEYAPAIPKTLTHDNSGTVVNRGVELSAGARLRGGYELEANYTWQDDPSVSDTDPSSPLLYARPPGDMASITGRINREAWFGSLGVTYTGSAYWSDVLDSRFWGPTSSYTLVNASAGVRAGNRTTFVLRGTDLTDRAVKQHYFGDIIRRQITAEVQIGF